MRRYGNGIFGLALMGVLFWLLLQVNLGSPRVDVADLGRGTIAQDQLVLLEGGTVGPNAYGGESRRFTLRWEGDGCLFVPIAWGNSLLVNGVEWDDLKDGKQRLFQFSDAPSADHVYEVELRSSGKSLSGYGKCVYIGPLSAVSACVSSLIISRYVMTGVCICILLFSTVLYVWKRSEKYLFWLTVYAVWALLRALDGLGIGLLFGRGSAVFQYLDYLSIGSSSFQIIDQLVAAYFNYQVMKYFLSTKIFGRSIMLYILIADVIRAFSMWWSGNEFYPMLLYYAVLYTCYFVCIEKDRDVSGLDQYILSVAWASTVGIQTFFILTTNELAPSGVIGLKIHPQPIFSCIYIVAFFIVACRRFAIKFQEADDLNAHLEATVRKKIKEQTAFIRSMLHNLKTPLFSLVGYTDMASESLETDPALANRCLSKVSAKAQYVSGMLDHLFLLTQMDANQMVFQQVPVRLEELLHAVEESARLKGKEKGVTVTLSAPGDAFCLGDPLYLQQAFQNIADNAVEHVEAGGHLDIRAAGGEKTWTVTFADNGPGIAPEELPKIFDRYYSNHHGKRRSSGLGLTITKEIVEHHGGTITAQSCPEQGAEFTVTLPRYPGRTDASGGTEKM